ncbi:hypothetical protein BDZ85DRAFT_85790 [Elsinoe ampelina]|uniref:Uncharacterized protein n=1 Tax=Elsinoe ampelina TaxID=302913 RepID=A0A6A6GHG8_9PEZI|nr:hypothetical protein BDZ85DRAFT_85790 [Elsinoe ampelina]
MQAIAQSTHVVQTAIQLVNLRRRGCSGHHAQSGNTDRLQLSHMRRHLQTSRPKSGTCKNQYSFRSLHQTCVPRGCHTHSSARQTRPLHVMTQAWTSCDRTLERCTRQKRRGRAREGGASKSNMYCIMHARHIATRVRESRGMRVMRECFR